MTMRMSALRCGLVALLVMAVTPVRAASAPPPLVLERVVLLMRHGVRPPTKDPAMPDGIAAALWPKWPVAPGYLTAHGADGVRLLGMADRQWLVAAKLLPVQGCSAAGTIAAMSDSDQRTIATGDAYLAGLAPGCGAINDHRAQDQPDPLFATAGTGDTPLDPAPANAAVAQAIGPGGIAAVEQAQRALLIRLDRILCGDTAAVCGVSPTPSAIAAATPDRRPRLTGALDRASTAAQILLLEYAEDKPMAQVGWGRATPADITAFSAFHALEFRLLARPPYIAAANIRPLAERMLRALTAPAAPRVIAFIGHDTNVASLGGLLDLHWQAPGYAADDPPPGGAIVLELLRDARGARYVRVSFRAQSLDGLRALRADAVQRVVLAIPNCAAPCPLAQFRALVTDRLTQPR